MNIQVDLWGQGPRVVLVHGVMSNGPNTWRGQRQLAEDWTLVVPSRRGYVPNPPIVQEDYDADADDVVSLLGDGAHLVGHSMGGLVAMLAAARCPEAVRSLCLLEPGTHALARNKPEVTAEIAVVQRLLKRAPAMSPREFLIDRLSSMGADVPTPPDPLPDDMEQHVRLLMHSAAYWERDLPSSHVAAAAWPKVVVSGAHDPAQESVCDATATAIQAERLTLPGAGHLVQRAPGFNELLRQIWTSWTPRPLTHDMTSATPGAVHGARLLDL